MTALLLPLVTSSTAEADQPEPGQASLSALTAKVDAAASRVHQLTENLDQARLEVSATSAHLSSVTHQYAATVQSLQANRTVLVDQAVQAYMNGDMPVDMMSAPDAGDLTINQEYLQMASGDLTDMGDQLHQLQVQLQSQQIVLRAAQKANVQAAQQLANLRNNAVSAAGAAQAQLDSLQARINAAAQAQAAAAQARAAPVAQPTQGVPVNNGLVTVVQQAAGLPIATPVATNSAGGSGGGAGGSWLALRMCESSDNYRENTGNGFFGAYQFSQSTWTGLGFSGRPDLEPPSMQDQAAMKDQALSGWGQWPACASALGLL